MNLRISLNFEEREWVTVGSCWEVRLHLLTILLQVRVAVQDLPFLRLCVREPLWVGQNFTKNVIPGEIITQKQGPILGQLIFKRFDFIDEDDPVVERFFISYFGHFTRAVSHVCNRERCLVVGASWSHLVEHSLLVNWLERHAIYHVAHLDHERI